VSESHALQLNADTLDARLGEVYTLSENYTVAMLGFQIALHTNPDNQEAQRGMDRLEKVMRGIDPDSIGDTEIAEDASPGGMDALY
jgi:anaphase-promoting complex subunit 7